MVAYIEVASQSQEQAAALLKSWAETVRKNPDNLGFAPLRRLGPTNHFAIVEFWKDAKAFENQSASPEGKQFRSAISPLLIAPYDEGPHSVLAADAERSKAAIEKADKDTVVGVTHVDVIPPKKDGAVAWTKGLFAPVSKSAGNLAFDVLQQMSRQNHMTLFELEKRQRYGCEFGAELHEDLSPSLQDMSGSLFDLRTYTILR